MRTYRAGLVGDPDLRREFQAIERAATSADPFVEMTVLHAEPAKLRAGMYVTADGTDWDPGSGEGLYRRDSTNTAWVFVG